MLVHNSISIFITGYLFSSNVFHKIEEHFPKAVLSYEIRTSLCNRSVSKGFLQDRPCSVQRKSSAVNDNFKALLWKTWKPGRCFWWKCLTRNHFWSRKSFQLFRGKLAENVSENYLVIASFFLKNVFPHSRKAVPFYRLLTTKKNRGIKVSRSSKMSKRWEFLGFWLYSWPSVNLPLSFLKRMYMASRSSQNILLSF